MIAHLLAVICVLICTQPSSSALRRGGSLVQPVFHNVHPHHVPMLAQLVRNRPFCSVSLRHDGTLDSLREMCAAVNGGLGKCKVGASTVTTIAQIDLCKKLGAEFISTISTDPQLIRHCVANHMPVFSGLRTLLDAEKAISCGATFLKVYPSSEVSPALLAEILSKVTKSVVDDSAQLRIFVSGGIRPQHVLPYLKAGATDFIIGLDAAELSYDEMQQRLADMDCEMQRAAECLSQCGAPGSERVVYAQF